jgi:hypothetical protein
MRCTDSTPASAAFTALHPGNIVSTARLWSEATARFALGRGHTRFVWRTRLHDCVATVKPVGNDARPGARNAVLELG